MAARICSLCAAPLPDNSAGEACPRCVARACESLFAVPDDGPARLELGEALGTGGMGEVFAAHDATLERTVALKRLRPERAGDLHFVARFENETRVLGRLEHPGIVPLYDGGRDAEGRPFYTMRRVQGVTLHDVLQHLAGGNPEWLAKHPLPALLTIFQKICDAVAFAHSRGVIHRDLKPENIMLGAFGEALVMDWGLARVVSAQDDNAETRKSEDAVASPAVTLDGAVMGTPSFMAPEQADGRSADQDERTDIFALGAILYAMLALRPPVDADTVEEVLQKTRSGEIIPPADIPKDPAHSRARSPFPHCPGGKIPESLSAVAMKALALRREDRYQTVVELQRDVTAYQNGFATSAEDAGLWRQLGLLMRRHRIAALTTAGVLVLVTVFVAKIVASERRASSTLAQLRKTLPLQRAEVNALIRDHKFEEALPKLAFLNSLAPDDPEFHALRGNVNQSLLRFADAAAAYEQVLRLNKHYPHAAENISLCREIITAHGNARQLPEETILRIRAAFDQQKRFAEAAAMQQQGQASRDRVLEMWKQRLRDGGLRESRVKTLAMREDGLFELDASGVTTSNLTFLQGIPLWKLMLDNTSVTDLSPLRDMPLKELSARNGAHFGDLRPLQGLPLRRLAIHGAPVRDLRPLWGMKLNDLDLIGLDVTDIGPLQGMPLRGLRLQFNTLASIEPLRGMTNMRDLNIMSDILRDITPLRDMPLTQVGLGGRKIRSLEALRGKRLSSLRLNETPVSDLSPLQGMKLQTVHLHGTAVTNLSVLRGMPVEDFYFSSELACDLSPLSSFPLKKLWLSATNVEFSALLECRKLESVALPMCKRIEVLRDHPSIQLIVNAGASGWSKALPPAEFWPRFDERKRQGTLRD